MKSWKERQSPSTADVNATHTMTSKAFDAAGNSATSAAVSVSVSNGTSSAITLSVHGYKVKGLQKAYLSWSGATSTSVDVFRNGALITTTANDGAYTDNINVNGGGTYTYKVCEAGTTVCSNDATVTF
ncbi:MAG TPA: chitinase N-terminal domain-containing protein [Thermoanaerobaculia bacterium]|nr:chitinase N-terminal domain-containing protein [Thermoanaerobaculia bacterium]